MDGVVDLPALPPMRAAFTGALVPRHRRGTPALPPYAVRVRDVATDPARLSAYATVCGYATTGAPAALPATWIHVLTFPLHVHLLSARESSVRLVGAVHVCNTMTMHAVVPPTERLTVTVHATNLRPHHRGSMLDLVGEASVAGQTVWSGVSTYLATGVTTPGEAPQRARLAAPDAPVTAWWDLPAGLGRRYRDVSGDPNPIHTSRIAARMFGLRRPIIHGMWTHARALAQWGEAVPEVYTATVDFLRPIGLPSRVGFAATREDGVLRAAVMDSHGERAHCALAVTSP